MDDELYTQGYWMDSNKQWIHLSAMSDDYILNVYYYLQRTSEQALEHDVRSMIECPRPTGEMAQDCFDDDFNMLLEMTPEEYMEEHPFYDALVNEIERCQLSKGA